MKFQLLFLVTFLTAITSAATIKNHFRHECKGAHKLFRNIAPRTCAPALHRHNGNPAGAKSIKFQNMPHHARLFGWQSTRDGQICGAIRKRGNTGNKDHKCMGIKGIEQFAGSSWAKPAGQKREEPPATADEKCEGTMQPQAIVLDDGHMYNTEDMSDDMFDYLTDLAANGTTQAGLPSSFAKYVEDEEGVQARLADMQGEEEED